MLVRLAVVAAWTERSIADGSEASQAVDTVDCDCYLTNGSVPTYYSQRMFFDFRNLAEFAGVPDTLDDVPDSIHAPPSSEYFETDSWTSVWELQTWDNRKGVGELSYGDTVLMVNSPNNVYLEENDDDDDGDAGPETFMAMRTARLPGFQTAAEFQSTQSYHYVSLRMLARTIGDPGAVTAMFTYRHSEELADVQEADIEFLTNGPRDRIQYTNQPSYTLEGDEFPEAARNASVPGDVEWTRWMVHRLDWTPDECVWYVDGEETARISYQTPRDPAQIIFNAWSDGGAWSGNMSVHDAAYLQIQWIEMVFNTTGEDGGSTKRSDAGRSPGRPGRLVWRDHEEDEGGCGRVCSIDERDEVGAVTMLSESPAPLCRVWASHLSSSGVIRILLVWAVWFSLLDWLI